MARALNNEETEQKQEEKQKVEASKLEPYRGADDLPEPVMDGPIVKELRPQYFCHGSTSGSLKVIEVVRVPKVNSVTVDGEKKTEITFTIKRRLFKTLKPANKKRPQDKQMLASLRKAKIPGAQ